jgi:ABC-type uncharacterized transport system permease subunit
MSGMISLVHLFAIVLYLIAAGMLLRLFARNTLPPSARQAALATGAVAVLIHAVALGLDVWRVGGLDVSFFRAAGLVGWIASSLVLVRARREPVESAGVLLFPATALALLADQFVAGGRLISREIELGLALHILASVLAYSFFTLAALQAVVLALQDWRLRRKSPLGFSRRLPPIPVMEGLLFQWITAGFVLLSLGLAIGWVAVVDLRAQHLAHKAVFSVAAWLIFAVLMVGRWRAGWRGRTAIRWTLAGFLCLVLAYFGSKFVLELVLNRA